MKGYTAKIVGKSGPLPRVSGASSGSAVRAPESSWGRSKNWNAGVGLSSGRLLVIVADWTGIAGPLPPQSGLHSGLRPVSLLTIKSRSAFPQGLIKNRVEPSSNQQPPPEWCRRDCAAGEAGNFLAGSPAGNERFVSGDSRHPNQNASRRSELVNTQNPFAVIFGCSDSRLAAEIIFDVGLGDVFVVRTAGHVTEDAVLGSLGYGVSVLHVPLIVVLGIRRRGRLLHCGYRDKPFL